MNFKQLAEWLRENKDFEDSQQMIAAEEAMCTAIITFDKTGFKDSRLPVYTPDEILNIWERCK